jgi:hypothetical protein
MENWMKKAEDALDNFLDDPEKVDKAKQKAEDLLAKRMDRDQADQVVNKVEDALESWHQRRDEGDSSV